MRRAGRWVSEIPPNFYTDELPSRVGSSNMYRAESLQKQKADAQGPVLFRIRAAELGIMKENCQSVPYATGKSNDCLCPIDDAPITHPVLVSAAR